MSQITNLRHLSHIGGLKGDWRAAAVGRDLLAVTLALTARVQRTDRRRQRIKVRSPSPPPASSCHTLTGLPYHRVGEIGNQLRLGQSVLKSGLVSATRTQIRLSIVFIEGKAFNLFQTRLRLPQALDQFHSTTQCFFQEPIPFNLRLKPKANDSEYIHDNILS